MKLVPTGPFENKSVLLQVMGWRWTGGKPLPEPMMTQLKSPGVNELTQGPEIWHVLKTIVIHLKYLRADAIQWWFEPWRFCSETRAMLNDKMPLAASISIWHNTDLSTILWLQMRIGHVCSVRSGTYPVPGKTPSCSDVGGSKGHGSAWCHQREWRTGYDKPVGNRKMSFQERGHNKYLIAGHRLLSSRLLLSYP